MRTQRINSEMLAIVFLFGTLTMSAAAAQDDNWAAFKTFVAEPPEVIESLIFELMPLNVTNVGLAEDMLQEVYVCKLQSDAFYLARLRSLEEAKHERDVSPVTAVGRYQEEFWSYDHKVGLAW